MSFFFFLRHNWNGWNHLGHVSIIFIERKRSPSHLHKTLKAIITPACPSSPAWWLHPHASSSLLKTSKGFLTTLKTHNSFWKKGSVFLIPTLPFRLCGQSGTQSPIKMQKFVPMHRTITVPDEGVQRQCTQRESNQNHSLISKTELCLL